MRPCVGKQANITAVTTNRMETKVNAYRFPTKLVDIAAYVIKSQIKMFSYLLHQFVLMRVYIWDCVLSSKAVVVSVKTLPPILTTAVLVKQQS